MLRSRIRTQSFAPAPFFPGGVKDREPLLASPVPASVYVALVGSNQRPRDVPLITLISIVKAPVRAGGLYATSSVPSSAAEAATYELELVEELPAVTTVRVPPSPDGTSLNQLTDLMKSFNRAMSRVADVSKWVRQFNG